jgi:ribosomal protein L19E
MNLGKKKILAAKALKTGKNRIVFNVEGLPEIKEAITKQDIQTLKQEGIITIKPVKGRKKIKKRKTKRGPGKIKKKVNQRKQTYVKITRKLRGYVMELKKRGDIDRNLYIELRKRIRMRAFRSKANLKEFLKEIEKRGLEALKTTSKTKTKPKKSKKTKKTKKKK